ncbi:hypothetical protein D3C86_2061230 [compost metagenome]
MPEGISRARAPSSSMAFWLLSVACWVAFAARAFIFSWKAEAGPMMRPLSCSYLTSKRIVRAMVRLPSGLRA